MPLISFADDKYVSVRSPLKLLKEKLMSDNDSDLNFLQCASDFKTRLSKVCELAKSNLQASQTEMKKRYGINSKDRTFDIGDQVLALLPATGKPLQPIYFGPYIIEKKLSDVNYVLKTPDRPQGSTVVSCQYVEAILLQKQIKCCETCECNPL